MRISGWSSDVCSSVLGAVRRMLDIRRQRQPSGTFEKCHHAIATVVAQMKQIVITTEHRQAIITNLDDAACLGRLADAELCEKFLCAEHTLDDHFDAPTGALAAKQPRSSEEHRGRKE